MSRMFITSLIGILAAGYLMTRTLLYKGEALAFMSYLKKFSVFFFLFMLIHGVTINFFKFIPDFALDLMYVADKFFLLMACFYIAMLAFNLFSVRHLKFIRNALIIFVAITTSYMITDIPEHTLISVYPFIRWSRTSAIHLVNLFLVSSFLFASFSFLLIGRRNPQEKSKFYTLSLVFFLWLIGGPLHAVKNELLNIFADGIIILGFLLMSFALFSKTTPQQADEVLKE